MPDTSPTAAEMVSDRPTTHRGMLDGSMVSMMLVLPLLGIFFAQMAGVIFINARVLLLAALAMLAIDAVLVYMGMQVFERETILTKWK